MKDIKKDPNYDFNAPVERVSTELAKMIVSKFDENKEFLLIENFEKADPIAKAAFIEKSTDFSIDIINAISLSDIPYPYATKCIDKIMQVLVSLQKYIDGTITQSRHELESRVLGVRSPQNGKFTEELATYGTVMLKLKEVRDSQGNIPGDYFDDPTPIETGVPVTEEDKKEIGLSTDA